MAVPDDLLDLAEAADLLRVDPRRLRDWIREGRVPALRLAGRELRIRRSDLDVLLVPTARPNR